jgi:hypothetical protein
MSTGIDPYRDHCTVRVRVFLRNNGRQGRIDGPPTAGQNDYQELRMRPDKHDDYKLVGVYGSVLPGLSPPSQCQPDVTRVAAGYVAHSLVVQM